jgi:hypothetical protein
MDVQWLTDGPLRSNWVIVWERELLGPYTGL